MYDIIALAGVSGAGKSYLIEQSVGHFNWLCQIPAVTTREKRDGVDEHYSRIFVNDLQFDHEMIAGNLLFVNDVFGRRYAYRKTDINEAIKNRKTILLDIKLSALSQAKQDFPELKCIYVKINDNTTKYMIGVDRNSHAQRLEERLSEQNILNDQNVSKNIDFIFKNNMDDESLIRFFSLLESLN